MRQMRLSGVCMETQPRTRNQEPGTVKPPLRGGFTLVELLAVITLISVLIGIVFGTAQFVVKTARQRQAEVTQAALENALTSYRHEYGKWPVDPNAFPDNVITNAEDGLGRRLMVNGPDNWKIFDLLRVNNITFNQNGIPFIDESTVLGMDNQGNVRQRCLITDSKCPLVYKARDGTFAYFTITNWFELDKVDVGL